MMPPRNRYYFGAHREGPRVPLLAGHITYLVVADFVHLFPFFFRKRTEWYGTQISCVPTMSVRSHQKIPIQSEFFDSGKPLLLTLLEITVYA